MLFQKLYLVQLVRIKFIQIMVKVNKVQQILVEQSCCGEGHQDLVLPAVRADLCNLDACNNVEDLFFNKGRLAVIRMLLNYEDYVTRLGEEDTDYGLQ